MKGRLLIALTAHDLRSRYAGTFLGALWAFASPLLTIAVYWFVYTVAFSDAAAGGRAYAAWLTAGMLPWFFFSDGLTLAASCFFDYRFLVVKRSFPIEKLPLVRVCAAAAVHLGMLCLTYPAICRFAAMKPQIGQLWTLFWVFGGFLWILGTGRMLALLAVYLRDVRYGLQPALSLGFWLTPIFWDASGIGGTLRVVCDYNPAAILADGYRSALLYGTLPSDRRVLAFWLMTAVIFAASTVWMKISRPTLADRL